MSKEYAVINKVFGLYLKCFIVRYIMAWDAYTQESLRKKKNKFLWINERNLCSVWQWIVFFLFSLSSQIEFVLFSVCLYVWTRTRAIIPMYFTIIEWIINTIRRQISQFNDWYIMQTNMGKKSILCVVRQNSVEIPMVIKNTLSLLVQNIFSITQPNFFIWQAFSHGCCIFIFCCWWTVNRLISSTFLDYSR